MIIPVQDVIVTPEQQLKNTVLELQIKLEKAEAELAECEDRALGLSDELAIRKAQLGELREVLVKINICRDKDCGTCAIPDDQIPAIACGLIQIAKGALKRLVERKDD